MQTDANQGEVCEFGIFFFCHMSPPLPQRGHHLSEAGWPVISAFPLNLVHTGSVFCSVTGFHCEPQKVTYTLCDSVSDVK